MTKEKLIYIASPYSHDDLSVVSERFKKVALVSAKLVGQGKIVFSPIVYGHTLLEYEKMPSDWKFWQTFCLTFLDRCDELYVLTIDGYKESIGVNEEIAHAKSLGIKITYIDESGNEN